MATTGTQPPGEPPKTYRRWWIVAAVFVAISLWFVADYQRPVPPELQVKPAPRVVAASKSTLKPSLGPPAKSPLIRVNVTPEGTQFLKLDVRGDYIIRAAGSERPLESGNSIIATKVQGTSTEIKLGKKSFKTGQLEIVPRQSPMIRVNDHLYRGSMRLIGRKDGTIYAVNVLPLEEYLASVVDSEMPAAFPEAARQAQAIVCRTYALYKKEHAPPESNYDLFSTQRSQKYLGVEYIADGGRRLAGESESSRSVVKATRGIVCQDKGRLFCTYYSAVCGGATTNGSELFPDASPILKSVPCEWCKESEYYRWTADLNRKDLSRQVASLGTLSSVASIRQTSGPGGGVVSRFQIGDGQKTVAASGVELRDQLPATTLRSPHFSLELQKERIRAQGQGHGHGVGFCQWGARGQGLEGKSTQEILQHYYPGAQLVVIEY